MFDPQVKTRELGWHGWIFLRWAAPMFGIRLNVQWFSARPTSMFGKNHLNRRYFFLCCFWEISFPQEGSPPLSWKQRCLIAEGTANGLEYLHSNHHIHRDVKRYWVIHSQCALYEDLWRNNFEFWKEWFVKSKFKEVIKMNDGFTERTTGLVFWIRSYR